MYYADTDSDGFGDINNTILSCEHVLGYVENTEDCNDDDVNISPDALEKCDNIDNN